MNITSAVGYGLLQHRGTLTSVVEGVDDTDEGCTAAALGGIVVSHLSLGKLLTTKYFGALQEHDSHTGQKRMVLMFG